jgi:hypothetical protein
MATREDTILEELAIGPDLDTEFRKQAAYFAYRAFQSASAHDRVRLLEERVDLLFSRLYAKYRSGYKDAKENDCKSYIRKHKSYKLAQEHLRIAKSSADILKVAVKAFEMRSSMLMQLGAMARAEYESTDPKIRVKRATRKANKKVRKVLRRKGRRYDG